MSLARPSLAASLHRDCKIGLHVTAVGQAPTLCPQLSTLAAHVWSHLQPSNSLQQSIWGRFRFVFPSPAYGLLRPGTTSDSSLGTKQLLNKCLLSERTHEEETKEAKSEYVVSLNWLLKPAFHCPAHPGIPASPGSRTPPNLATRHD